MSGFDVSVIIPTYNRAESLRRTLGSLARQTYPMDGFEVIVVDDGSTDDTSTIAGLQFPFLLRYIRQANQGSAAARNRGAQDSRGDILILLDDDMLVEPDYIAGLVEEHRSFDQIVGMGTCHPHLEGYESPFAEIHAGTISSSSSDRQGHFVAFTDCVTNNLSVERKAFFEIGMMQDVAGGGPSWWGDVDFGYRAQLAGFRFRRSGKAMCKHCDYAIRDLDTACRRIQKAAQMAVLLFQRYPDLQPHLPMFRDKTPISLRRDPPRLIIRKIGRALTAWRPALWGMEQVAHLLERCAPNPPLLRPLYRWIISSYMYRGYRQGLREYGPVPTEEHR